MSGSILEFIGLLFAGKRASIVRDGNQEFLDSWETNRAIYLSEDGYRHEVEKRPILAPILGFFPNTSVGKAKQKLKNALATENRRKRKPPSSMKESPVGGPLAWESSLKYLQFKTSRAPLPLGYGLAKRMALPAHHVSNIWKTYTPKKFLYSYCPNGTDKHSKVSNAFSSLDLFTRRNLLPWQKKDAANEDSPPKPSVIMLTMLAQIPSTLILKLIQDPLACLLVIVGVIHGGVYCFIDAMAPSGSKESSRLASFIKCLFLIPFVFVEFSLAVASYLFSFVSDAFFLLLPGQVDTRYAYQLGKAIGLSTGLVLTVGAAVGKIAIAEPIVMAAVSFLTASIGLPPLAALIIACVFLTYVCALAGTLVNAFATLTHDTIRSQLDSDSSTNSPTIK